MKRKILTGLAAGVGLLSIGWLSLSVSALSTTPTDFLQEIPLQVSAYGWSLKDQSQAYDSTTNPHILRYIQLYNDSDTPIAIDDWQFVIEDTNGTLVETEVTLGSSAQGWLAPNQHVVAGRDSFVTGATYSINNEVSLINMTTATSSKVKLLVRSRANANYRPSEHVFRLDSASSSGSYWQRSFSSTGEGYTSSFMALGGVPTQLFDDGLYSVPPSPDAKVVEIYPYSSTCAPNDSNALCGDYIKLHVGQNVDMSQYVMRTSSSSTERTSSNTIWLGGDNYQPNSAGFVTVNLTDDGDLLNLTNGGGYVWLEDLYGLEIYNVTMSSYPSAGSTYQGWSWALDNQSMWQWTSTPQPGLDNLITRPVEPVCPEGKYLNPESGRCRTIEEAINTLAACPEGQTRNPSTNRCRQNVSASSNLQPCGEGQERNPLTNRCRSIASAVAELLPCDEGEERNPLTNRCRKVTGILAATDVNNAIEGATNSSDDSSPVWGWALVGVATAGVAGYGIYEWRQEIIKAWQSFRARFSGK